jgi:transposase InsO family protein
LSNLLLIGVGCEIANRKGEGGGLKRFDPLTALPHEQTMTGSHNGPVKPSDLLALVGLSLVGRHCRSWLGTSVCEAARQHGIVPERVSRLTSRLIGPFEAALTAKVRIGRPIKDSDEPGAIQLELELTIALLEVATCLLRHVSYRKQAVRALIVGAYQRLSRRFGNLTQKRFCQVLAMSDRTLRTWLRQSAPALISAVSAHDTAQTAVNPKKPQPKPPRPPRRPRFSFSVTLPDLQQAADTTDLSAFDVPLKLMASQDIGGRDEDLLDAVIVDTSESGAHIAQLVADALEHADFVQWISDQGKPYLSQIAAGALQQRRIEHAPQREYHPTGKATMERAFGSIKSFASPLLHLTNQVAKRVKALADPVIAIGTTHLLLVALLRAFQAGARATMRAAEQRAGIEKNTLVELARHSRERARALDRSANQLLSFIHDVHDMPGTKAEFVRKFRVFDLAVLDDAIRRFEKQAHRDDIRNRKSYFAAIVLQCHRAYRARRDRDFEQLQLEADRQKDRHRVQALWAAWRQHPQKWLFDALQALATQWLPAPRTLLCNGSGLANAWIKEALGLLAGRYGTVAARDIATTVHRNFSRSYADRLGPDGLAAVKRRLDHHLNTICPTQFGGSVPAHVVSGFRAAILNSTGPKQRPPPPRPLTT